MAAKLNIQRKIYPATSIRNPQLLNSIRLRKKHKYVDKFERLITRIKISKRTADRQLTKRMKRVASVESSIAPP